MSMSKRRVRAIFRKELREYRHNGNIIVAMVIFPLIFLIQPLLTVLTEAASASNGLAHEHVLLYMLAIPALVPAALASYSVVGERQQGTLEPVLATPIRREEFLLGKALAAFVPSLAISYAVLAFFLACVELFAHPGIAPAAPAGPGSARPAALHAAPRRMVDLGRHRDLGQIQRRTRCRAAQLARESPVGRSDNAPRAQRDPRHARPSPRRSGGTAGPRRTRLADHLGGVRPRTSHHQHPLTRCDHLRARRLTVADGPSAAGHLARAGLDLPPLRCSAPGPDGARHCWLAAGPFESRGHGVLASGGGADAARDRRQPAAWRASLSCASLGYRKAPCGARPAPGLRTCRRVNASAEVGACEQPSGTGSTCTPAPSASPSGGARSSRSAERAGNRLTWCDSTTVTPPWCSPARTRSSSIRPGSAGKGRPKASPPRSSVGPAVRRCTDSNRQRL